jgi:hypothetical protein
MARPLFHTHISDDGSKRFTFEAAPSILPTRLQTMTATA